MEINKYNNSPYKKIPEELKNEFTMNNSIPILEWWFDGSKKENVIWDDELINNYKKKFTLENIQNNNEKYSPYGNKVTLDLINSLINYNIVNKNVAVIGSEKPWIEAILLNLNNNVTTIEYNVPECKITNLNCKNYFSYFIKNSEIYDCIVTFSSIEHSGLGRYGDPLDPNGDIKTMDIIHKNLKKNGLLLWGAPVGKDALVWNAHRIYGEKRLPLIFKKFKELEWIGETKKSLFKKKLNKYVYQPIVILKKLDII